MASGQVRAERPAADACLSARWRLNTAKDGVSAKSSTSSSLSTFLHSKCDRLGGQSYKADSRMSMCHGMCVVRATFLHNKLVA